MLGKFITGKVGFIYVSLPCWSKFFPFIGVGRFRILRGQGLECWGGGGGQGGAKFPAGTGCRTDVNATHDVASTSMRRHVPTMFLISQCQIITFLFLKSDNIENSRIESKGILLPVPSNQIKLHLLLFFTSAWYICDFFPVSHRNKGKCGRIIGGPKGMLPPTSQIIWGAWPP